MRLAGKLLAPAWSVVVLVIALLPVCMLADVTDIRIDSITETKSTSATFSWSHTVGDSENRYLIVSVAILGSNTSSPPVEVLSVKYGGTSLASIGEIDSGTDVRAEQWHLVPVSPGTREIEVTLNYAVPSVAFAVSLFNVHQTYPRRSHAGAGAASGNALVAVASELRDLGVDILAVKGTPGVALRPTTVQTQRTNQTSGTSPNTLTGAGSTMPGGDGSVSARWNITDGLSPWAHHVAMLKPIEEPDLARMRRVSAERIADGSVELFWQTALEIDNLGFKLYREDRSGIRTPITPLIAGSALFSGNRNLTAGRTYRWLDPEGQEAKAYWLEDIDLKAGSTFHGPIAVSRARQLSAEAWAGAAKVVQGLRPENSLSLAAVGRSSSALAASRFVFDQAPMPPGNIERQWELAANPEAVRIAVREDGWYRITREELVAAGFDPGKDLRNVHLYTDGLQQPVFVGYKNSSKGSPQGSSVRFARRDSAGDFLEFFGRGLDTPFSDTRIYWLVRKVSDSPLRVSPVTCAGAPAGPDTYVCTAERKDRTLYFAALRDESRDNFFGPVISRDGVDHEIHLDRVSFAPSGPALLTVSVQGATKKPHRVAIKLNGHDLGTMEFDGLEHKSQDFQIEQSWLNEGSNRVTLAANLGDEDVSLIDFVRISYRRPYIALENQLTFTVPVAKTVRISGFESRDVRVVDMTDPEAISELYGTVTQEGDEYSVSVTAEGEGTTRLLYAFAPSACRKVQGITLNSASWVNRKQNGADYLIIAPETFMGAASRLKTHREADSYSVLAVDVQDVFDEFSFGAKDPGAIRAFLARATAEWERKPRYVLFIGDGTQDPRNYLGFGKGDMMPAKLVATTPAKTPSDDWFVDFDDSGFPQLAIGRLPASTPEQAERMIDRIINYDDSLALPSSRAVFVTDDGGGDDFTFEELTGNLRALFPASFPQHEIQLGTGTADATRQAIVDAINQGAAFVSYVGHGSTDVWSSQAIFESKDALALQNGDHLPVFLMFNCLNGFFSDVYTESLAEALLKAQEGGALAVIASSSLTDPLGQDAFAKELLGALFGQPGTTLGEAVVAAKKKMTDWDIRKSFILFGDPASRIRN